MSTESGQAQVGYGIVSFAVLQIIEPVMHALHLPDVTLTYVVLALAVGFPVAVVLAWAFDVNEGRIERAAPAASAALTGTRLRLLLVGIGLVAAAPGVIWYFVWPGHAKSTVDAAFPTAASATPSIAVLPFADMSPQKDQEYFSDGIAEEILNALAQVDGLRVAGRTSSFSFKGKSAKAADIGRELNVGHLLEGSVRHEGNRIRITAQLVNAADGYHLWSQTYNRELTSIFAVQDEIAQAVVVALRLWLVPGQHREPSTKAYSTDNPEVYRLYLLGRYWGSTGSEEGYRRAIESLQKAVTLEPGYAPAYANLALAHQGSVIDIGTAAEAAVQIRRAIAEAERPRRSRLGTLDRFQCLFRNTDLKRTFGLCLSWQPHEPRREKALHDLAAKLSFTDLKGTAFLERPERVFL